MDERLAALRDKWMSQHVVQTSGLEKNVGRSGLVIDVFIDDCSNVYLKVHFRFGDVRSWMDVYQVELCAV